jgi:tRNA-binding EMAP/Myf-like protein
MLDENNQVGLDFAEVWRAAQHRRTDDIAASDVDILKTVTVFCGIGLLVSLIFAISSLDIVGFF